MSRVPCRNSILFSSGLVDILGESISGSGRMSRGVRNRTLESRMRTLLQPVGLVLRRALWKLGWSIVWNSRCRARCQEEVNMRRHILRAAFGLLLVPFVNAADVSGNWTGSLEFNNPEGDTQSAPAQAELKQLGNSLTGKVWKEAGHEFPIAKGKIEGNQVTFQFTAPEGEPDSALVHSVKLTLVSPTQLRGLLEFEAGGQKMSCKLTLTRKR